MSHSSMQESAPEDNNSEPGRGTSAGKCRAVTGPVWARLMDLEYANVGSNESQEEHTHLRSARHTSQGQHHTTRKQPHNHRTHEHMGRDSCHTPHLFVPPASVFGSTCPAQPDALRIPTGARPRWISRRFCCRWRQRTHPCTNQPTNQPPNQPTSQPASQGTTCMDMRTAKRGRLPHHTSTHRGDHAADRTGSPLRCKNVAPADRRSSKCIRPSASPTVATVATVQSQCVTSSDKKHTFQQSSSTTPRTHCNGVGASAW